MKQRTLGLALTGLALLAGFATRAAAADLADIRLGAHEGAVTRIVLDLRGGGAGFSYSLSDDGQTLTVALRADAKSPALPHRRVGLVHRVTAAPITNGTRIDVSATSPISIVQTGVLEPEGAYRFYRIYFDLGPATASPGAPVIENHPAVAAAASTSVAEMYENPQVHEAPHAESHETHEAHEEHHPEPMVTVKLGGSFERSVSDYSNNYGPTAALQTGMFHDALELELGTTALMKDGPHTATWKTGLIVKKPIELSENAEFAFGAGPIWLHRPHLGEEEEAAADSAGVEGVLEMVFWPGEHHSLGFYAETGYSYDFGKGHEKAAGAGAGVLVPLP
jgi:hypothetical protein